MCYLASDTATVHRDVSCLIRRFFLVLSFFFFNDTATTEIYTLSLHDALPISRPRFDGAHGRGAVHEQHHRRRGVPALAAERRSEEHTSELQSPDHLVCRLLLEKKKEVLDLNDAYNIKTQGDIL